MLLSKLDQQPHLSLESISHRLMAELQSRGHKFADHVKGGAPKASKANLVSAAFSLHTKVVQAAKANPEFRPYFSALLEAGEDLCSTIRSGIGMLLVWPTAALCMVDSSTMYGGASALIVMAYILTAGRLARRPI